MEIIASLFVGVCFGAAGMGSYLVLRKEFAETEGTEA